MDPQLQTLIDLQALDTRLAALSGELAKLPDQLAAIQAGVADSAKLVETLRATSRARMIERHTGRGYAHLPAERSERTLVHSPGRKPLA